MMRDPKDFPFNYNYHRKRFIKAATQDQADASLREMLRYITMTTPDLDDIRTRPWPGSLPVAAPGKPSHFQPTPANRALTNMALVVVMIIDVIVIAACIAFVFV